MTLLQWCERAGVASGKHITGAVYVNANVPREHYRELFALSDYAVSSVQAGTAWMVERLTRAECTRRYNFDLARLRKLSKV